MGDGAAGRGHGDVEVSVGVVKPAPLPHPVMAPMRVSAQGQSRRRGLSLRRKPKSPAIKAAAEMPKAALRLPGGKGEIALLRAPIAGTKTVIVVPEPVPGVRVEGEKVAVAPAGRPEAVKVTGAEKLPDELRSMMSLAEEPRKTVRSVSVVVTMKSGVPPVLESATVAFPALV